MIVMIEIGLVGVPSSGKSTFFKAATLKDVKIASYPFTTIEPNEGLAYISAKCPCKELGLSCSSCIGGIRFIPVKLWDVAGLVPGAHLGRGHGNAFLDDIMQASALIHVLDVSGGIDSDGNPTDNFDPAKNIQMLEEEITYWLLGIFKKDIHAYQKNPEKFSEIFLKRFSGLGITKQHLDTTLSLSGLTAKELLGFEDENLFRFIDKIRQLSKPIIIAANKIDLSSAKNNFIRLKKRFSEKIIIPTSAECELALREASAKQIIDYLPGAASFKIKSENITEQQREALEFLKNFLIKNGTTGVQDCLNKIVFDLLDMIVVYPVEDENKFARKDGKVLPDALLVKRGTTARELAYKIHQEIGDKFIAAIDARTKQQVSADYVLKNNDIISIRSGR